MFHVSLLEQDTTKKGRVNKNVSKLDAGNNSKEYKVKAIQDKAVYVWESQSGSLPGLYYLISSKNYPEEENTWELALAV